MKKTFVMMVSAIAFMATVTPQKAVAQEVFEKWPGVTMKLLTDNEKVSISEVTFDPGAVADWHSHTQYAAYAVTDVRMKVEMKDKEAVVVELKSGQAMYSPAVTHKTTNVGKKPFTVIVTEIK